MTKRKIEFKVQYMTSLTNYSQTNTLSEFQMETDATLKSQFLFQNSIDRSYLIVLVWSDF